MQRHLSSSLLFGAVMMMALSGCFVRPPGGSIRVRNPPPPRANATVTVQSQPTVASGVTVVESSCNPSAQEVCNGLDDNCNGQIDEGCGYSSGNIQVTLAWGGGADLDMYIQTPSGETIYYGAPQDSTGGHLDQDARGACAEQNANNTIENVYWNQPNPPAGQYRVQVHYWDGSPCSTGSGPTNLTLSIAIGGQVRGAWNYTISPGERVDMAAFQI